MLHLSAQKEQFSLAYAHAIATVAGLTISAMFVDDDSVDLTLVKRAGPHRFRSPRLDLQLKCTARAIVKDNHVSFPLKRKNYDDLRSDDFMVPRILVVMQVPSNAKDWLTHSELCTTLHKGAWWASLRGAPSLPDKQASKSVSISRDQVFSPAVLKKLMAQAGQGVELVG